MELCQLTLCEEQGLKRRGEPVFAGVPLPKGALVDGQKIRLVSTRSGEAVNMQARILGRWQDQSIRWLKIDLQAHLGAYEQERLRLETTDSSGFVPKSPQSPAPLENPRPALVKEGLHLELLPGQLDWRIRYRNGQWVPHHLHYVDDQGQPRAVNQIEDWTILEDGPLVSTFQSSGVVLGKENRELVRLVIRLSVHWQQALVRCDVVVHNPRRAAHPGGLWDLGDPGSVHFKALELKVSHSDTAAWSLRAEPDDEAFSAGPQDSLRIYQDSSGGPNWDSRNHQDANGIKIPTFQGYRLTRNGQVVRQSIRATPTLSASGTATGLHVTVPQFWQNFPSALGCEGGRLDIGFFPGDCRKPYELQGGERKTLTAWLHYGDHPEILATRHAPTLLRLSAKAYEAANSFPWFSSTRPDGALEHLIDLGLAADDGFFQKREKIDEYGWRNFGDLYADHETIYQKPDEPPFLSHYNNQYDAIFGFARQFALTGDRRWYELMDDLARHVADIDIYHTSEDRAEYNGGLFWHTDHYLDAHTATHRTYSKHNSTSSVPGQTGGGPAAEHCYTTGLLYHHWLTGSTDSRNAVLELAHWIRNNHEGTGGLFEQLLKVKKQDLPRLKKLARHNLAGVHRYPFTRGTGNYINTLLDASLLEPDQNWLAQAERVIKATINPYDDIDRRDLHISETGWSYLVLLASLVRYLGIKLERDEIDESYRYTLQSLRHYWRWMVKHEKPFLEKVPGLEFPNHTWVAQDIRKAMLMFQASVFDPEHREAYQQKAHEWLDYVTSTLLAGDEKQLTRIQVLLLQNYGPHTAKIVLPEYALISDHTTVVRTPSRALGLSVVIAEIFLRLIRGLRTFRPTREKAWLRNRVGN